MDVSNEMTATRCPNPLRHHCASKPVWQTQTWNGKRWDAVSGEPQRLAVLLEEHAEDAGDLDFIVPLRFRHVETGEVISEGEAYAPFIDDEP